jgi:hypothetical protein
MSSVHGNTDAIFNKINQEAGPHQTSTDQIFETVNSIKQADGFEFGLWCT